MSVTSQKSLALGAAPEYKILSVTISPHLTAHGALRAAALATVVLVCASCATGDSPPPSATQAASSAAAASQATPRPTAPAELQGLWQATISTGEDVTLELRPSGFIVIRSGARGTGSIRVDGDQIVFASHCELGPGTYTWEIEGGTLTFTPGEPPDPCGNRIIFLEGAEYTRVE